MQLIKNIFFGFSKKLLYLFGFIRASYFGVKVSLDAKIHPKADIRFASSIGDAQISKNVILGKGSYINSGIIFNARIGNYVSIAYNVIIGPSEHNINLISMSSNHPYLQKMNISADLPIREVIIEDDVWVGANAVILQGVTIGQGSVIAAGAVVTKDIPPMEVWAGVPARKIKDRIIISYD